MRKLKISFFFLFIIMFIFLFNFSVGYAEYKSNPKAIMALKQISAAIAQAPDDNVKDQSYQNIDPKMPVPFNQEIDRGILVSMDPDIDPKMLYDIHSKSIYKYNNPNNISIPSMKP